MSMGELSEFSTSTVAYSKFQRENHDDWDSFRRDLQQVNPAKMGETRNLDKPRTKTRHFVESLKNPKKCKTRRDLTGLIEFGVLNFQKNALRPNASIQLKVHHKLIGKWHHFAHRIITNSDADANDDEIMGVASGDAQPKNMNKKIILIASNIKFLNIIQ